MLVIDASCLYEVVADAERSEEVRQRMSADTDQAPHIVDVEVLGVIRQHHLRGLLDRTAASQAVDDLRDWPGDRYAHRALLGRAWELRATVRSWDAMYVALAEALGATLLTLDSRLAATDGPRCPVELVG